MTSSRQALPRLGRAVAVAVAAEAALVHLGRTYGSTREERSRRLPGDEVVADPVVQTDHAITIDAPPSAVWPWLVQMGWGRGGWYTARWVDRVLFPANGPSADRVVPELQDDRGRHVHPRRPARERLRAPRRPPRAGAGPGPALHQPPAPELAGPGDARLDLGVRAHPRGRRPGDPLPLPVPVGHPALVAHPGGPVRSRARGLPDVARRAPGRQAAGGATGRGPVGRVAQWSHGLGGGALRPASTTSSSRRSRSTTSSGRRSSPTAAARRTTRSAWPAG